MERLYTPWRMEYIKRAGRDDEECIFCTLPAEGPEKDEENLILARGDLAFVIVNKFPYNVGHLIVAPYRHTSDYATVTDAEHAEIGMWEARCMSALEELYQPHGYNLGTNLGRAGGAGIEQHLHKHIVPRWTGDANFMTIVGDTKVLPESLEQTYTRARPLLAP
jgi:ATP adenylyltransferase